MGRKDTSNDPASPDYKYAKDLKESATTGKPRAMDIPDSDRRQLDATQDYLDKGGK
jgi:hypothetical protein